MFDRDEDVVQRVIDQLRQPVEMDPTLDAAVMARVAAGEERINRIEAAWEWLRRPRDIAISPLAGLAAAAALAGLMLWLAGRSPRGTASGPGPSTIQFVVRAPGAGTVALVGDFNDWDGTVTPMRAAPNGALWSVTVPLAPGRYRYAFLVNGSRWLVDPAAPRAPDDFDTPSSIVTVGG
ncbi:MAG TPA: isoamylase early set domain-containing protein [Gemmatimonadales bacterium]|nr:isoamylase early set domain-containing protein [Gemmatimonadales bacterium]